MKNYLKLFILLNILFLNRFLAQEFYNHKHLDSIQNNISKNNIIKNIEGTWKYQYSTDLDNNQVFNFKTGNITMILSGFIFRFENKKFEKIDLNNSDEIISFGHWDYDDEEKHFLLTYKNPHYEPSIEKIAPSFLEEYKKMIAEGKIHIVKAEYIIIEKIENDKMTLLQVFPLYSNPKKMRIYRSIYYKLL